MANQLLLEAAMNARKRAYAPYSGYAVGAAILDEQGQVHTGCNVENVSYGITLCAERCAIGKMIVDGGQKIIEIAVATKDGSSPCGMCLQAVAEFAFEASALMVHMANEAGNIQTLSLQELLPVSFCSSEVTGTKHI